MQPGRIPLVAAILGVALGVGVACDGPQPTETAAIDDHDHTVFPAPAHLSPEVNRKIAELP